MMPSSLRIQSTNYKRVMISSTTRDLPEHREMVRDACVRQSMLPIMMEYLPASDANAISESIQLVDTADIYIGIFAHRYGFIPKGSTISITEMEYDRALERGIPCLIFLMHEDHQLKIADVEKGEGAVKLETFKVRLLHEHAVNFYTSPTDLGAKVINSLSRYRQSNLAGYHYISDIPEPPESYIAHPYTLLQTSALVGRQTELRMLTEWITDLDSELYYARILNIVALGGMGKSAVTWKWFHDIAPYAMKPLAGRLWWSFYESDATFENFVIRALAYISHRSKKEIHKLPPMDRETQLLAILDREPFLLVLDGLERILVAYARMEAAHMMDDDLDQRTSNIVIGAVGLPDSSEHNLMFTGRHILRKTSDPRVGTFLRKLAMVKASRILVSTRLYPADLQTDIGGERTGCKAVFLCGLTDADALKMWKAFHCKGSSEVLLSVFHTFDNHPLLIQALAGVVAQYRRAPGNFDHWRKAYPAFDPFHLPMVQVKSHILAFALLGLGKKTRTVLHTIAAFRMPAMYDTLVDLLVGNRKLFSSESQLVAALTDLEDRGLLGWDRRANRYDLHPIVRGVTWSGLDSRIKVDIFEKLNAHFRRVDNWWAQSLDELTATIELYNTLVGLERYDAAVELYFERLNLIMRYRLGASRQCAELLKLLFPDGLDQLPRLKKREQQSHVLNAFALSLRELPKQAVTFYQRSNDIDKQRGDMISVSIGLSNMSNALRFSGALYESEVAVRKALLISRQLKDQREETNSLYYLGVLLATRGEVSESVIALNRSLSLAPIYDGYRAYDYQAMLDLWLGKYDKAKALAERAEEFCRRRQYEWGIICALRLRGIAALNLHILAEAEKLLHKALVRARKVNLVEEELPALIGLAELKRRRGDIKAAHELLEEVWEPAERGPFPTFLSDAHNALVQIELDAGNNEAAGKAASSAYHFAWCDGPPFAYHWGIQVAKSHLSALSVPEPCLPTFDPTNHKLVPKVKIVPEEEE